MDNSDNSLNTTVSLHPDKKVTARKGYGRSVEERVEDWCKAQLRGERCFSKNEPVNPEIAAALAKAPSKRGGEGRNFPDIQMLVESDQLQRVPVMIEVKGTKGALVKADSDGTILNEDKKGQPLYGNISRFAVNGAVHYADAILRHAPSYDGVIAVGLNGCRQPDGTVAHEVGAYWVSRQNLYLPVRIADYEDLSFLKKAHLPELFDRIRALALSDSEIEERKLRLEDEIERNLKEINQKLHDEKNIVVGSRVKLLAGLVMAGLGVKGVVSPLKVEDLKGEPGEYDNDGQIVLRRIAQYLESKNLPREKRRIIMNELNGVFTNPALYLPENGESKLHGTYSDVASKLIPFLTGELHNLDFTGRMFNVLNAWVDVPDGAENDVVLTPRYVTEFMARLCGVNKDSYVWDFATGSGGFLISAMHEMIADAKARIKSPEELEAKILHIKMEQLLGVERLSEIYMLAVLNMILMKDGSANIIKGNSLTEFKGRYEQGARRGEEFPANVFLLNPPYSAEGKGFVFVDKALSMMSRGGMAAVLIQENAGSGSGLPYTRRILERNTLVASIRMSDIFCGKASVQTAVYVFRVGTPHDVRNVVRFINFENDGYSRQNRRKSSQSVNLRDTGHARERYAEVVSLVRYGRGVDDANLNYYRNDYIEDHITLDGNDWTYSQHIRIDTTPGVGDFNAVVKDYLAWRVSHILRSGEVPDAGRQWPEPPGGYRKYRLRDIFDSHTGDFDIQAKHINGKGLPVVSAGAGNNGIIGHTDVRAAVFPGGTITVDMFGNVFFQPMPYHMVTHARVFCLSGKGFDMTPRTGLYLVGLLSKLAPKFSYSNMASWSKIKEMEIELPVRIKEYDVAGEVVSTTLETDTAPHETGEDRLIETDLREEIDFAFMESCMASLESGRLRLLAASLPDSFIE